MARPPIVKTQVTGLWKVTVATSPEAEEAVCELLGALTGTQAGSYQDLDSKVVTVSAFLDSKARWSAERTEQLRAGLRHIRSCGLEIAPGRVSVLPVSKSWAESWKRHFRPLEIGNRLLIKPSWSPKRPRTGQELIVLDPGLSFGTGQHPTTSFCLEQLAKRSQADGRAPMSFLDLGTGSGILAIAAAKLGYKPILAVDYDPESMRVARENAKRNNVARQIRFRQMDVTALADTVQGLYSVICANLTADVLLAARDGILSRLAPGGLLALAGILKTEFKTVQSHYQEKGLKLVAARTQKEWRSGAFARLQGARGAAKGDTKGTF